MRKNLRKKVETPIRSSTCQPNLELLLKSKNGDHGSLINWEDNMV